MTKKDYVKLANVFKAEKPSENWDANKKVQWDLLVKAMANTLKADNYAFKSDAFVSACGGLFYSN